MTGGEAPRFEEAHLQALRTVMDRVGEEDISMNAYDEARDEDMPSARMVAYYEDDSWTQAKKAVADEEEIVVIERATRGKYQTYTDEECLEALESVVEAAGFTVTAEEYDNLRDVEMPSSRLIQKRLGWSDALDEAVGRVERRNTDMEECLAAVRRVVVSLQKVPTRAEYMAFRELAAGWMPGASTIERKVESDWGDVLEVAGFESPKEYSRTPAVEARGTANGGYGEDWPEQRRKALERDGHTCQVCGMTRDEHKEKFGRSLDVHHIVPFDEFETAEEANRLENLVSVCRACHAWLD